MPRKSEDRCYVGHEMTPENTYFYPDGRRDCRECSRARWRAYYRRRKKLAEQTKDAKLEGLNDERQST